MHPEPRRRRPDTFRDWHPVGVEYTGYVAPDPLDPDIIYGGKRVALRSADGTSADRRACRCAYGLSRRPRADPFSPLNRASVFRVERIMANHERRSELGANRS